MFEKFDRAVDDAIELDLLPVMNLMMVLIPFLLLGAAFYHIGTIPASLPAHTPQESDVPETPTTVTVNVTVKQDSVDLTASSVSLGEEALQELAGNWPVEPGDDGMPVDEVQAHLKTIKQRYPESDTMIVLPYEELPYQKLVKLLDGTREYQSGTTDVGDPTFTDLFPVVVFSRYIQSGEEPQAGSAEE